MFCCDLPQSFVMQFAIRNRLNKYKIRGKNVLIKTMDILSDI